MLFPKVKGGNSIIIMVIFAVSVDGEGGAIAEFAPEFCM
jgi:hypothetical protein